MTVLQLFLSSPRPAFRFCAMRTLSEVATRYPVRVHIIYVYMCGSLSLFVCLAVCLCTLSEVATRDSVGGYLCALYMFYVYLCVCVCL